MIVETKRYLEFKDRVEFHFWGNVDYSSNKIAMKVRNRAARIFKKKGYKIFKSVLSNQLHKYFSLGSPDGTIGNVYILLIRKCEDEK